MRLIDADKIDFGKVFIGASDFAKDTKEAAQNFIKEQPTAYDIDKVVAELEDMQDAIGNSMAAVQNYLRIVKQGIKDGDRK